MHQQVLISSAGQESPAEAPDTRSLRPSPQDAQHQGLWPRGREQGLSALGSVAGDTAGLQAVLGPEATESAEQGKRECVCMCVQV